MSMSEIQQAIQDADAKFSKMARELESLRQENSRLREALSEIANTPVFSALGAQVNAFTAQKALNPPKRS